MFELMRGDLLRVGRPTRPIHMRLAREHDLSKMERAFGLFLEGWATAASGAPGDGLEDMRRGVEQLREQNVLIYDGAVCFAFVDFILGVPLQIPRPCDVLWRGRS